MDSKESLKAKRHQLYCSIADALQHTSADDSSDILGRLQAVLEAEACLSCIDGEEESDSQDYSGLHTLDDLKMGTSLEHANAAGCEQETGAGYDRLSTCNTAAARRTSQPSKPEQQMNRPATSAGLAMSALQDLKQELARSMHQSMQAQQKPRPNKFMSCSSLLSDLRTAQREKAALEEQLESAQAAAARQSKQHQQEVRKYKRAVEQAAQLAEAANSRVQDMEQQLALHSQDAVGQTQQLAEQAKCTVKLGAELRQVKQHMMQLHLSVIQPLLRWQHDQQVQPDTTYTSSSRASSSRKKAHKPWQPPAAATADVIASAAAAIEQLLLQQGQDCQGHQLRASQDALLQHSCKRQQRLQDELACAESELQELRAELAAARQEAATACRRADRLQQQVDAHSAQHDHSEQLHGQELAVVAQQAAAAAAEDAKQQMQAKEQQLRDLQQQVNRLTSELACAQGEAAAAQRQVARLQEEHKEAAAEHDRQLQQLKQAAESRQCLEAATVQAATDHNLQLEHIQALAKARQAGQQAVEDAQQAWREQRTALEKQHLQTLLRSKQVQEQERLQWQKERDELVQQLTAQYTASGMQMHMEAKGQLHELRQQVQQLRQERDELMQQQGCDRSPIRQQQQFRHSLQHPYSHMTVSADGERYGAAGVKSSSAQPAAFALQFSHALQTADADRSAAVRRAATAEQSAAELRRQLSQQERELQHLRSALDELRSACEAANNASAEAEASAAASNAALQEQVLQVQQLQKRLDEAGERHQYELRALRQSMTEQIRVVQADARAELEAAQTRLQLVRLKQQRMVTGLLGSAAAQQQEQPVSSLCDG